MSKCDSCFITDGRKNNDLYLCKDCYSKKLITKTNAKKDYMLNDKDIADLRCAKCRNNYGSGIDTTLYLVHDIEKIADEKYGSKEERERIKKEKELKRQTRKEKKEKEKDDRYKRLDHYLKSIGLSGIRSDSVLCSNYVEKGEKSGYDIADIGFIMDEMNFYHNRTEYSDILYKLRGEEFKWGYYVDEESLRIDAKSKALYNYIKTYYKDSEKMGYIPQNLKQKAKDYCIKKKYPINFEW